jgi:hypothetical protein
MASNISNPLAQALLMSGGNPSAYAQLMEAQRRQQMAAALQQQGLEGPQAPTPISGGKYTVAPRTSALSAIASPLKAYMGSKLASSADQQMAQAMQGQGGPDSDFDGGDPASGRSPGPKGILGLDANSSRLLYMTDRASWAKLRQGTTEQQNARSQALGANQPTGPGVSPNLHVAGITPEQQQAAAAAKAATVEARQGMTTTNLQNNQTAQYPTLGPGQVVTGRDQAGNPTGAAQLPGSTEAAAQMEGAQTAAKEQNTPRLVPQGGGVEKLEIPNWLNYPGAAGNTQPQSRYFGPQQPAAPKAPAAPAQPAAPPGSMWNSVPKVNVPNTPGQTTDAYHQQILHNAGKKDEELVNQYSLQARTADARLAFNKEALKILNSSVTGPAADTVTHLSALAAQYGFKNVPFLPSADVAANTQMLKKYLLQNPLQNLKPTFGGRPAASEFQVLANDASPSPKMLNSAIARLVTMDSTRAAYEKQQALDYGRYQAAGGDPRQYEQWYADHKPLGRTFLKADTPPQALERFKQHPDSAEAFRRSYGWVPGADD